MSYVGEGLVERSFEECVTLGLNPNPNPPGRIMLPDTDTPEGRAHMLEHIRRSQKESLAALRQEKIEALPSGEGGTAKQCTPEEARQYFQNRFDTLQNDLSL